MATPAPGPVAQLDLAAKPAPAISKKAPPRLSVGFLQSLLTLAIFAAMWFFAQTDQSKAFGLRPQRAWMLVLACLIAYCLLLGSWLASRPLGILVNERNLMSLSRFQTVAWTLVVSSGYFFAVLWRIGHQIPDPLNIQIDPNLWLAMGISFASLVGAPLLLNSKKDQEPSQQAVVSTSQTLKESVDSINQDRQGTLYSNRTPADARISDIFQGDEVGNTAAIDLAKLQMFIFTILLLISYASELWHFFAAVDVKAVKELVISNQLADFPKLSQSQVSMLALSHAGYLASKTVSYTPSTK